MRSLRLQLLVGTALATTAVLLVTGAALYALISRTLWEQFDESLAAKARSLTTLAEQDEEGLEFELSEVPLPEFEPSQHAEFYQAWLSDGTVLARSPSLGNGNLDSTAGTFDAPVFHTVVFPDARSGRIVGIKFEPRRENGNGQDAPSPVTLVLGRDVVGLQHTLAQVRGVTLGVCLTAVLLSAAVLAWVVRRGLGPLDNLSRQIADVGEGDLSARIGVAQVPSEMSPVVDCLNDLLARLEAAFQRERRFAADVAHELRNPLAGLRATLELALSRDRDPAAYRETLGACLSISHQMHRMVDTLLHSARAEAGQLEIRREPVELTELVRECWQTWEGKAQARNLLVEWHLHAPCTIETDRDKLWLIVQNILDNAVAYANREGRILLSTAKDGGRVTLAVSNTGSTLSGEDVPRVFDRFWRSDSSYRAVETPRCGLGLSLCKTMIEQLGGAIEANADLEGMFTITVHLPVGG